MAGKSITQFAKDNIKEGVKGTFGGAGGLIFGPMVIADIANADNKFKAILKTLKDIALMKPIMAGLGVAMFSGMKKAVNSLVQDTGSLKAALEKLAKIQGFEKMFAPMVGGAEAARKKVAELVILAASKNLKLEAVGEGARSLQVMTKGAFSGAQALTLMADAAKATANGFAETSGAVGQFMAAVNSGGSIDGAVESLREMGLVTNITADRLTMLQENGAGADMVIRELTSSMSGFTNIAAQMKDGINEINAAADRASESLQEKFGAPWVAEDVANTERMTAAMNAVAPAVGRVSAVWQVLFNTFSPVKKLFLETVASSPALVSAMEAVAYSITGLVTVVGALSAMSLANWFRVLSGTLVATPAFIIKVAQAINFLSFGFLGLDRAAKVAIVGINAMRWASLATGIGIVVAVLGTAYGIWSRYQDGVEAASKAIQESIQAHNQANTVLLDQISNVQTLGDKYDALAAALDAAAKAQKEFDESKPGRQMDEAQRNLANANAAVDAAKGTKAAGWTKEEKGLVRQRYAEGQAAKEQDFRAAMAQATPAEQSRLLGERQAEYAGRAASASAGSSAGAAASRAEAEAGIGVMSARKELSNAQQSMVSLNASSPGNSEKSNRSRDLITKDIIMAGQALEKALSKEASVGQNAPQDSAVYARSQARKSTNAGARSYWEIQAELRGSEEGNAGALAGESKQAGADKAALDRERGLVDYKAKIEREIAESKLRGFSAEEEATRKRVEALELEKTVELMRKSPDQAKVSALNAEIATKNKDQAERRRGMRVTGQDVGRELGTQAATYRGDSKALNRLGDMDTFASKLEELRGQEIAGPQGEAIARTFTNNSIALDARSAGQALNGAVAGSSLTRIGGGGNVGYSGGGDPVVEATRRIAQNTEDAKKYLEAIKDKISPNPTTK